LIFLINLKFNKAIDQVLCRNEINLFKALGSPKITFWLKLLSLFSRKIQILAKNQLCNSIEYVHGTENFTNCNDCPKALQEIKIPLEEIFFKCKFQNQVINCTESFKETIVGYHLCYIFNGLELFRQHSLNHENMDPMNEEWSVDKGYQPSASADAYPRRALGAGPQFGVTISLRGDKNGLDESCSQTLDFKVWLSCIKF
jgi:Amiloride-sensitive sodium channel